MVCTDYKSTKITAQRAAIPRITKGTDLCQIIILKNIIRYKTTQVIHARVRGFFGRIRVETVRFLPNYQLPVRMEQGITEHKMRARTSKQRKTRVKYIQRYFSEKVDFSTGIVQNPLFSGSRLRRMRDRIRTREKYMFLKKYSNIYS